MKFGVRAALAATIAVGFALTGCSSGSDSGTKPSADAATLVQQSADAMKQVTGFHFELTAEGKVPNLKVTKVVGDVSNKPAPVATGTATISMGQQTQDAKIVYVDGHLYSDVAEPGKFTDYGDGNSIYNATVLVDPQKGVATMLANLKDAKVDGTEDVNGVKTTKISGTSSSKDILVLAGSRKAPEKDTPLPTTVWIANDDSHHLVKAELKPAPDATVDLTLSDYNKQVTATKPV